MHGVTPHGRVLIIAGSDSGGGAGIQGDIKTVSAFGGYAMTAITALTAQNTHGVFGIHPIPEDFIAQQITLCLSDIGADAIKTGMLHSASVIEAVTKTLDSLIGPTAMPLRPLSQRERAGVRADERYDPLHSSPHLTFAIRETLSHAQDLRHNQTDAEKKLWQRLRDNQLGAKFRRQHPVGPYIVDFICIEAQLIIELDGGQHAEPVALAYDEARTQFLQQQDLKVVRFWNHDVLQNIIGVLETIQSALTQTCPHPSPLPLGEGAPAASLVPIHIFPIPLIVDPVMVAKGGSPLLEAAALDALKTKLIPRATLITPNLPEAELLLGHTIDDMRMEDAARELLGLGSHAVLLKGGHGTGATLTDILVTKDGNVLKLTTERIETRHTHGTGCAMASAIAAGLAQGLHLADSFTRAHEYVQDAIRRAPGFGQGNGPLGH